MNVEVTSDDEFTRCGSCKREERIAVLEKDRVWFKGDMQRFFTKLMKK